jgi:transcriptional regulator with XRE-family HTH domain
VILSYGAMTIADKLTRLITNQSEVARKTGVAQSAISEASSGKRRLYVDQAMKIARALGVSLDYLADDAQDEPAPSSITADEERVLWLVRELGLTAGELARRLTGEPGGKARESVGMPTVATRNEDELQARDEAARLGSLQTKADGN